MSISRELADFAAAHGVDVLDVYEPNCGQHRRLVNPTPRRLPPHVVGEAREYGRILHGDPCSYCGIFTLLPHIDHIEAKAAGGDDEWDNLTVACDSCNTSKGASHLLLWLLGRMP